MQTIQVVLYREGKFWVAQALNVDVSSFGDTKDEARAAIKEALELYFEDEPAGEVVQVSEAFVETVQLAV
ncbi:MAG: type II toxin-antitoxin system HicB family antitoxin [Chloroflexi bacterium]|nr:type II toxin-antitoxin system HicB family antitoxin [Chloroflexota bacterium]